MGLSFSFDPIGAMPSDGYSYMLEVFYDINSQIIDYYWHDPVWAPEMGGFIGSAMDTDAGPYIVNTYYRNPSIPVRSTKLDIVPWSQCSAAWINFGLQMAVTETTRAATFSSETGSSTWEITDSTPGDTVTVLIQGVDWNGGSVSYTQLGGISVPTGYNRGYDRAMNATELVNAYLNNRGHDGYAFIPSSQYSQPPSFSPTVDFMMALHKATYNRGSLHWNGSGWEGACKEQHVTFIPPSGGTGVAQFGELELPSRARVTYRPVAEGWR